MCVPVCWMEVRDTDRKCHFIFIWKLFQLKMLVLLWLALKPIQLKLLFLLLFLLFCFEALRFHFATQFRIWMGTPFARATRRQKQRKRQMERERERGEMFIYSLLTYEMLLVHVRAEEKLLQKLQRKSRSIYKRIDSYLDDVLQCYYKLVSVRVHTKKATIVNGTKANRGNATHKSYRKKCGHMKSQLEKQHIKQNQD